MGPLVPLRSMYVVNESRHQDGLGRPITYTYQHFPIRMHWGSVLLGYSRVWLVLLALAAPFVLMYGESVDFGRPEMFVSYGLLGAWLLSLVGPALVPHRLGGDAARLAELTGIALEPERMEPTTRNALRSSLIERAGVPVMKPTQVREAASGYDEPTRADVWGACYLMSFDDPAWGEVAEALRERG